MLLQLLVRNLALIDQVELTFDEGLHVLTGETGAGKSIVIDAMNLLLGGRADRELVRTGCEKAYAEGLFDVSDSKAAQLWLSEHEFSSEDECVVLSREVSASGRSICRIQGVAVPLSSLKEIASLLMDMHGQHAHQSLLDDHNHLKCLDALGDEAHHHLIHEVESAYKKYREEAIAYKKMKKSAQQADERMEDLRKQEEELDAAALAAGEEETLQAEREMYRSAEKITQALREASAALYESGAKTAAIEQARGAMRALSTLSGFGKEYAELSSRAESLYYDLEDLGLSVRARLDALDDDPDRAAQVEERLDLIKKLSRKYGATTAEMIEKLNTIREEIAQYEDIEDTLEKLKKKALAALAVYQNAAKELTASRKKLAEIFAERMESQLHDLNMKGTRFYVDFLETNDTPTPNGYDDVQFQIAPNAGEEKKPLSKIASGGELSRVMLSLKALSAERAEIPSMVFDEIDTGISGRTAQVVAQKMWDIAQYRQVICVTHLQQIAAMATKHFLISKGEENGRTHTSVMLLDGEQRTKEIARMLSGVSEESESAINHAANMLSEARKYREKQ